MRLTVLVLFAFLTAAAASAEQVFEHPRAFLAGVFSGDIPAAEAIWLTGERKEVAGRILGHPPSMLRVRYWGRGTRTAWIIDEIGKERPITVGVAIDDGLIERLSVLVYRESIGWEVRYPFFTGQFSGAGLSGRLGLTQPVDAISGATLSVRAVTSAARLALYLHGETPHGR